MSKVIVVANQKGGVCKTTTSMVVSDCLNDMGAKVLRVDMDPQCDFSCQFNIPTEAITLYEVLKGSINLEDAVLSFHGRGYIVPGSLDLAMADMQFSQLGREYLLKEALEPVKGRFDYIVIDTPPSLGILTINALTAADEVIIPMAADKFSLKGLNRLLETIYTTQKIANKNLKIRGVLLTRFDQRTSLHGQMREQIENICKEISIPVFKEPIRNSIVFSEMQALNMSFEEILKGNKNSAVQNYQSFVNELIGEYQKEAVVNG